MHSVLHGAFVAVPTIPVGDHIKRGGLDVDTVYTTVGVCVLIIVLGLVMARRATVAAPGKLQLVWEFIVGYIGDLVEENLGPRYRYVVPLAVSIFVLVLLSSWVEILPGFWHSTDFLPSPSADINLTGALAILVFVLTNAAGIRALGFRGWGSNILGEPRFLAPFHIITELVKPITLALRLFGNIFAGSIMIALLLAIPIYAFPFSIGFTVIWKLFDMFIGVIQAFIFALLTILYYQFATQEGAH